MVAMAVKCACVLFCYYLLLAGAVSVVSGFTPVTYPARASSECGQHDPLQDEQVIEEILELSPSADWVFQVALPSQEQILSEDS